MLFVHAIVVGPGWNYFERIDADGCICLNSDENLAALFSTWQEARKVQLWLHAQLENCSTTLVPFVLTIAEEVDQCRNS